MADTRTSAVRRRNQRRRVKRLEKIFSIIMTAVFLVPAVLSIVLFIRTTKLEREIVEMKEQMESVSTQLQEEKQTVSDLYQRLEEEQTTLKEYQDFEIESSVLTETEETDITEETETISKEITETSEKMRNVYLTFDDGPSSYTNRILDILKEYDVKATFFVIGKDEPEYTELYQRIVEEGHTLGMHSYSHRYDEIYASTESFIEDFEKLQDFLYDITGVESKVYRFPGGSNSASSLTDIQGMIDYLDSQGIAYFDWNVTSRDSATPMLSAEQIVDNCTQNMDYYNNAFILLHDSKERSSTVEALPQIIEKISALEDTQIVPITEDTVPVHQRIN
ncbi:MAG: polysaccharide deacetylase family protein [Lachnospiraceae bacterium]|nr:polysaccharide deacetylase family protein [Lachnospiraceae bacterium]